MGHTRRNFLGGAMVAGTGVAVAGPAPRGGLLEARIALAHRRLTGPGFPEFTSDFVLADVNLDPKYPRLYAEFSGDLSGRYVEALALHSPDAALKVEPLLRKLLTYQRPDGRFGDAAVSFADPAKIDKPHMALLWGNGRLLVGLVAHQQVRPGAALLAAARKLGDFLLGVRAQCSRPEVSERLKVLGAHGIICFTQLIEPLVMLSQATGDKRYLEAARAIAFLLPDRGVQHSHGYLSTLRGVLMLHEAAPEPKLLAFVEERFADLVRSPDYLTFGGVMEFFGSATPGLSFEDLRRLYEFAEKDPQDEGCSEADFLRLALQLWRVTGKAEHLERAERCLYNQFLSNQFHTGDFGHRPVFLHGFRAAPQVGMAWWCCSMHGPRALYDVRQALAARRKGVVGIDLFLDGRWSDKGLSLAMEPLPQDKFRITVLAAPAQATPIAVRRPSWATSTQVALNGKTADDAVIDRRWRKGDRIDVAFDLAARIETRDRRVIDVAQLGTEPQEGALFYGPWLMGVHEAEEPLFFRRPWAFRKPNNDNVVRLPAKLASARVPPHPMGDALPPLPVQCRVKYSHGGWPQAAEVTLRPIAAQSAVATQQTLAIWLPYARG